MATLLGCISRESKNLNRHYGARERFDFLRWDEVPPQKINKREIFHMTIGYLLPRS